MKLGLAIQDLDLVEFHFQLIKDLKNYFISHCKISRYETTKIWSSWVITHRSLHSQIDSFLPTESIEKDTQVVQNLCEKGNTPFQAKAFYSNWIKKCQSTIEQLSKKEKETTEKRIREKTGEERGEKIGEERGERTVEKTGKKRTFGQEDTVKITFLDSGDLYQVSYKSIRHKIPRSLLEKLERLYMNGKTKHNFSKNLLVLLNHYCLLDGFSFQWAVPPEAHQTLANNLDIKGELFASPINCLNNNYYSLFEIDKLFSSEGNFFDSNFQNLVQPNSFSVYQVNPPFIETIFIQSSHQILGYLQEAKEKNIGLMFIYIMPNWLDSFGYRLLKESNFLVEETKLEGGTHYFYESNNQKYIKVHFNTHILVLSTSSIAYRWTPLLKSKFKQGFKKRLWEYKTSANI